MIQFFRSKSCKNVKNGNGFPAAERNSIDNLLESYYNKGKMEICVVPIKRQNERGKLIMSDILYPTPHIAAQPADFARTVLMPGDPLRAAFIARTYLEDAVLVNNVRGIQGYTGLYQGKRVSVMASGMGMPSIGIYSYELFRIFGVKNIIRVGTAGAISPDVHVRDIVVAMGACTNSNYASQYRLPGTFAPTASYPLMKTAIDAAQAKGVRYHVGNCLSSDTFYCDDDTAVGQWAKMGVLCIEMEAAALYMNAARCGGNALALFTVSDHILTGEVTTAEERQTSFTDMMEIALETALKEEE